MNMQIWTNKPMMNSVEQNLRVNSLTKKSKTIIQTLN
jgi:hypothetical protein